jgi:hypothetical protein
MVDKSLHVCTYSRGGARQSRASQETLASVAGPASAQPQGRRGAGGIAGSLARVRGGGEIVDALVGVVDGPRRRGRRSLG